MKDRYLLFVISLLFCCLLQAQEKIDSLLVVLDRTIENTAQYEQARLKRIDQIKEFFGFDTKYQEIVKADLSQLKKDDAEVSGIISDLEESENIHSITMPKKGEFNSTEYDKEKAEKKISQGSTVFYNPYNQRRSRHENERRTPRVGLSHELQHSFDLDKKIATDETTENGIKLMDVRAINTENKIRSKTGDPKRTTYGTKKVPKELLE